MKPKATAGAKGEGQVLSLREEEGVAEDPGCFFAQQHVKRKDTKERVRATTSATFPWPGSTAWLPLVVIVYRSLVRGREAREAARSSRCRCMERSGTIVSGIARTRYQVSDSSQVNRPANTHISWPPSPGRKSPSMSPRSRYCHNDERINPERSDTTGDSQPLRQNALILASPSRLSQWRAPSANAIWKTIIKASKMTATPAAIFTRRDGTERATYLHR